VHGQAGGVGREALADAAVHAGVELGVDPGGEDADEAEAAVLLGVVEAIADEELVGHLEAHEVAHHVGLGHLVLRWGGWGERSAVRWERRFFWRALLLICVGI
jgi:hypothetical protein